MPEFKMNCQKLEIIILIKIVVELNSMQPISKSHNSKTHWRIPMLKFKELITLTIPMLIKSMILEDN